MRGCVRPTGTEPRARVEEVRRIVGRIRERWPEVQIVVRADSGFCREDLMRWCEEQRVDYVLGLARNQRLLRRIRPELWQARRQCDESGRPARVFTAFDYRTRKSWNRSRRVIAKAEYIPGKANPRFIVTSLAADEPQALSEKLYCARGERENRIQEQLCLFSDRLSTETLRANQLRVYFSANGLHPAGGAAPPGTAGHRLGPGAGGIRCACDCSKSPLRCASAPAASGCATPEPIPWKPIFAHAWTALRCGSSTARRRSSTHFQVCFPRRPSARRVPTKQQAKSSSLPAQVSPRRSSTSQRNEELASKQSNGS